MRRAMLAYAVRTFVLVLLCSILPVPLAAQVSNADCDLALAASSRSAAICSSAASSSRLGPGGALMQDDFVIEADALNGRWSIAIQEETPEGSSWTRGLLVGGLVGVALGLAVHTVLDAVPCDSCSGTGSDSSASGARLEVAIGFGLVGAGLGALIAR